MNQVAYGLACQGIGKWVPPRRVMLVWLRQLEHMRQWKGGGAGAMRPVQFC